MTRRRNHWWAAAALCVPAAACAQGAGNVQVYGSLTAGAVHRSNLAGGGSIQELGNSPLAASLIGFRGTEDLGGGLTAVFRLESGINTDSGGAGATVAGVAKFWNRQSFVGIGMGPAGTVTLGRQFHAATDRVIQTLDVYNVGGTTLHVTPLALFGVNRFVGNDSRADNSIKWRVNAPGGFTGALSHGLHEGTGGTSWSADLGRTTPAYAVGAYVYNVRSPAPIAATGVRPEHRVWGLGGNFQLGPVRPYVHWMDSRVDAATATGSRQRNQILSLGVRAPVGLTLLKAAWTHDKGRNLNGVAGRDGTKNTVVLSAEYALSRRTSLYATAFQSSYSGGYRLEPTNIAALQRDPNASRAPGQSIGIRHDF